MIPDIEEITMPRRCNINVIKSMCKTYIIEKKNNLNNIYKTYTGVRKLSTNIEDGGSAQKGL